jgi:hypothetical protein
MPKKKDPSSAAAKSSQPSALAGKFRDRIKEFRRVPAEQLVPSPENFRKHPEDQRQAMRAILSEIGFAGAAIARELPNGSLDVIDGHLRREECAGQLVPTLILDVTEEEARTLRTLYDPIGDLAKIDKGILNDVIGNIQVNLDPLQIMVMELSGEGATLSESSGDNSVTLGPTDMPLRPYEHYDYVLVLARNPPDWQALASLLGLEKMDCTARKGAKKIGLGRCVDAGRLLKLLQDKQLNAS